MSDYTPPMSRLRYEYVQMRSKHYGFTDLYVAEFDRALAAHDAQVRAEERERIAEAIHEISVRGDVISREYGLSVRNWAENIARSGGES